MQPCVDIWSKFNIFFCLLAANESSPGLIVITKGLWDFIPFASSCSSTTVQKSEQQAFSIAVSIKKESYLVSLWDVWTQEKDIS